MPIVPRLEKQVRVNPIPDAHLDERAPGGRGLDMLADAQQNFGQTLRREALSFGEIAIEKQKEIDSIELSKIKAERDSFVGTVLNEEERDPDYEGMHGRITKRIDAYDGDLKKNVNGRISKYVDNMIAYHTAALTPKIQEVYLKKQDDRVIANAMTASKQFEDNGDYESAIGVWDGVTGISEAKRTDIKQGIEKEQKKKIMIDTAAVLGPELYEKTNGSRGDAIEMIRNSEAYSEEDKKYYMKEVESYFIDKKQAENEIETKQFDDMYGKIRKHSGGHGKLRKEIESMGGIDERTRWGLLDALDSEFKVGKFAPKGQGGTGVGRLGRTNPEVWHHIQDLIDNGTILEEAPDWKTFRAKFKDSLSMTDLKAYGKMLYKNADGSDAADPEIKLQSSSIFNKFLDNEKITDPQIRARALDRYNYEADAAERAATKKGVTLSYEDRVAIMGKVVAPEVVGKTRTWYGRPTEKTKRRFEIPPEAEKRNGAWYFPDPAGKWVPLIFEDQ